jgi:hypothetical protein
MVRNCLFVMIRGDRGCVRVQISRCQSMQILLKHLIGWLAPLPQTCQKPFNVIINGHWFKETLLPTRRFLYFRFALAK